MWGNTVTIHSVFFLKTTKQNSQSAQYEKKKKSPMLRACGMLVRCRGLICKKKLKKNYMKKNCCNSQCFQGKNYKTKFLTSLILKK
jgi:hypothetical protein